MYAIVHDRTLPHNRYVLLTKAQSKSYYAAVSRLSYRKFFSRQNRKGFFTNSVKVGLQSTSNTGSGVRLILVAPA